MINKLAESHQGIMPIRVLQHNLIYTFENVNPEFLQLTKKVIEELGLDPGISYSTEEESVKSPYVVFNKIFINETFLSYIWCMCFSLTVLYEEIIVKKSKNDYFGNEDELINMELAREAYKLWEYGISLLSNYVPWEYSLPNPEYFEEKYEELIPKINGLYLIATVFVLGHEFAHIELKHNDKFIPDQNEQEQNKLFEKEADARAIRLVLDGINNDNKVTREMGLLIGLCSLLFFSSITKGEDYPDTDERIDSFFKKLEPEDPSDASWGIATLAYKLWDRHFEKGLIWIEGLESSKDQYNSIKAQIENLNQH